MCNTSCNFNKGIHPALLKPRWCVLFCISYNDKQCFEIQIHPLQHSSAFRCLFLSRLYTAQSSDQTKIQNYFFVHCKLIMTILNFNILLKTGQTKFALIRKQFLLHDRCFYYLSTGSVRDWN
jgi:hypothetical protein